MSEFDIGDIVAPDEAPSVRGVVLDATETGIQVAWPGSNEVFLPDYFWMVHLIVKAKQRADVGRIIPSELERSVRRVRIRRRLCNSLRSYPW